VRFVDHQKGSVAPLDLDELRQVGNVAVHAVQALDDDQYALILQAALRQQLIQRFPQGNAIKCEAIYDEPFWRADGLTGQVAGDRSPIKFTFDNSPPSGRPGVIVCFLEGAQARVFGRLDEPERTESLTAVH